MTCVACQTSRPGKHDRGCTPEMRFWRKVRFAPNGCWEWAGGLKENGYGTLAVKRRSTYAHRFAYERTVGPLRRGQVVMHICDNPRCVRAAHLRAGTQRENLMDMWKKGRGVPVMSPLKTACVHGHPYTEANSLMMGNGRRRCRECNRIRCAADSARRKQRAVREWLEDGHGGAFHDAKGVAA